MGYRAVQLLRCVTPLAALASLIAQGVALLTNEWLFSEEMITNPSYVKFNMSPELEYHSKYTISGLWRLCCNEREYMYTQSLRDCMLCDYGTVCVVAEP